jgi:endoglucanase
LGDVEEHLRVCGLGKGVAISFMDNSSIGHRGLVRALRALAIKNNIAWQVKTYVSGGNDTRGIQAARGAIACAVLSVPCRYIHSPSNVACFRDIESQFSLAEAFLSSGAKF